MIHTTIPAGSLPGTNALYRDFIAATDAPIQRLLGTFGATTGPWRTVVKRPARVDPALISALRATNAELGVDADVTSRLSGLADGSVRAVVTGQQPGVLGGPLLTLYKAATAIALCREIEARWGQRCVPVLWIGADDDDFAEVRDLCVLGNDLSRIDVAIDAGAYRPGLRVGSIGTGAVKSVWDAVAPMLPAGTPVDRAGALLEGARDFAHAAARAIVMATGGRIAVVDGREPALRTAGRDLLLSFFDAETRLRASIDAAGRDLEAHGYHAQLQSGTDSGLFLLSNGIRQRVPDGQRAAARAEFERDITRVSPGVVARNLLQDGLFAPVAVVLGPAEIAYRAQVSDVYTAMKVPVPVVVPRLSATFVPAPVREMMAALDLDAATLVLDAGEFARAASARAEDANLKEAARAVDAEVVRQVQSFVSLAGSRLDARAREKLERRLDDLTRRLSQALDTAIEQDVRGAHARWPFLSRLPDMFRRDTVAQERFLSLLTPWLFHGDAAWTAVDALASSSVADSLDGRTWHGVYSV